MAPAHSNLSPFPLKRKGKTNKHVDYFFSKFIHYIQELKIRLIYLCTGVVFVRAALAKCHSLLFTASTQVRNLISCHTDPVYVFGQQNSHFCGQCYGFVSHTRLLLIQCVGFHLCVFFTCVYFYNICVCVSSLVSFSIRNKK